MVFFNYATMQMAAKIVYYGPGLCGKTTNLHQIYTKTSPQSRGEMVSLETETDRTLFFDLLPIDVGVIGGFKTRLQLYTIPGQVFYNTTRKLVLKGVDGLVFVADSQIAMMDANVDSFANLRGNLAEIGLSLDDLPLVVQLNKRDLPSIASIDSVLDILDPERKYAAVEAVASTGVGVFETLKVISKLTLRTLRRRMTGEEPMKPAPRRTLGDVAQFRVKDEAGHSPASTPPAPVRVVAPPVTSPGFSPAPAMAARSGALTQAAQTTQTLQEEIAEIAETAELITEEAAEPFEAPAPAPLPLTEPVPAARPEPPAPPVEAAAEPAPEPDIDFTRSGKAGKAAVKTVKVRSNIDVMAELEALRKRATQATPKSAKKEPSAARASRLGRELHKVLAINIPPEILAQTRSLKVTVSFEDGNRSVLHHQEEHLEVEGTDLEAVALTVRIDQN